MGLDFMGVIYVVDKKLGVKVIEVNCWVNNVIWYYSIYIMF